MSGLKFGVGSCNDSNKTNALWPLIQRRGYSHWLWGGDNVYADYRPESPWDLVHMFWTEPWRLSQGAAGLFYKASPEKLRYMYNFQKQIKGYRSFIDSIGGEKNVMAIWDDHDVGHNDGGKSLGQGYLKESQLAFLDFIQAPLDDERRKRPGIYTSKDLAGGKVKVILLDTRQFRDSYDQADGDVLGQAQWTWLENELTWSSAQFNVLVSGVQVLPEHPAKVKVENWDRLPVARSRLIRLLTTSQAQGIFLVSGDVHFSEFLQANCTCSGTSNFAIAEFTSSGMTHSWATYPFLIPYAFECIRRSIKLPYSIPGQEYLGISWGELEFSNLGTDDAWLTTRVLGTDGESKLVRSWSVSELKPRGSGSECQCLPFQGTMPGAAENILRFILFLVLVSPPFLALFVCLPWMFYTRLMRKPVSPLKGKKKTK